MVKLVVLPCSLRAASCGPCATYAATIPLEATDVRYLRSAVAILDPRGEEASILSVAGIVFSRSWQVSMSTAHACAAYAAMCQSM